MTLLFWVSAFVVVYVYLGYPALIAVWARARRRSWGNADRPAAPDHASSTPSTPPGVSIVIAARNEAPRLRDRIENLLACDYPADRRQIIVVCDGCSDATIDVLAPFVGAVDVLEIPASGKAGALNAAVDVARNDILVFADARQRFAPDALRLLVAPFADGAVGGVSGELMLDAENRSSTSVADGIGIYWRYEKWVRRHESDVWSLLGATGAIYALRRSLWRRLPPDTLLDDVLAPMRAVLAGRRVVFEERAKAFDAASSSSEAESRRKTRTLAGNVQILWLEPRLLLPWANPVWVQYCSHKIGRLAAPWALLALVAASMALAERSAFYAAALGFQCGFYLLAGYGAVLEWRSASRRSVRFEASSSSAELPVPRPKEALNA